MAPSATLLSNSTVQTETNTALKNVSGNNSTQKSLDASLLEITRSTNLRDVPEPGSAELWEQNICCDHMITVPWKHTTGWGTPQLKPYGDLTISPVASCLHYATQCFEGMKAYRGYDGELRLFRPDLNAARLNSSARRIALPGFEPEEVVKLIKKLIGVDGARWLPASRPGSFIYIRPALIGNGRQLGVQIPKEALLFIVAVPWPDFSTESPPHLPPRAPGMRLLASKQDETRAWPGGFGHAKVGANYGPSFVAHGEAQQRGYDQILWLLGPDCLVTEAGASNFFVVMRNKETGEEELITAPLEDKVILPGVTRRSVIELVRERLGNVKVVERTFGMGELVSAWEDGRIVEAFVSGTAFFIMPVSAINFKEKDYSIPMAAGKSGKYAAMLRGWLKDIMYGNVEHEWGVVIDEEV